jgi:hypothetical protein
MHARRAIPFLAAAGIAAGAAVVLPLPAVTAAAPAAAPPTVAMKRPPAAPLDRSPAPLSNSELAGVVVVMERPRCYGECPVYEVEIRGDGTVRYDGFMFVKVKGTQCTKVAPEKVRGLVAEFEAARFLSMRDEFSQNGCDNRRTCPSGFFYDSPNAVLTLTLRGATHRVEHNLGCSCAPAALFKIEQHIDQLAGVRRWVGDNPGGQFAGTWNGKGR